MDRKTVFEPVRAPLADLTGRDYVEAVCAARAAVSGEDLAALLDLARRPVEFYPAAWHERMVALLPMVGQQVCPGLKTSAAGASSAAFESATHPDAAPLAGFGTYRVGQDGRLYLITKSEHYHAPLGHAFPGYRLLEHARALGIPNATHNNTRGHITRLLEEELARAAEGPATDGGASSGRAGAAPVPEREGYRVLNLETGSLAAEAAIKMMLARFYRVDPGEAGSDGASPRVPVFIVLGDEEGGLAANYHGTAVLAQILRGMWPGLRERLDAHGLMRVRPVRPNRLEDLEAVFAGLGEDERAAGFLHELVLMNYRALRLDEAFVRRAYALCAAHRVPTFCDEIQSCLWAPGFFLCKEYGVQPDLIAVGKGFPGGEYPASRLLLRPQLDALPLFGALVTNGQEELASLAYLITMRWAQANAQVTAEVGRYYEDRLRALAAEHRQRVAGFEGWRHLAALRFHDVESGRGFAQALNRRGVDISVQTYKTQCPPAALTKLPLTAGFEAADFVAERMNEALRALR